MKWIKKIAMTHCVGDRRVVRKFLFLPRMIHRLGEVHTYWLQHVNVVEELQQFKYSRGDDITHSYEEQYENKWVVIDIKEISQ